MQPAGEHGRNGEVRVDVAARNTILHPCPRSLADQAYRARAVVVTPANGRRCEGCIGESLVRVDVRRIEQGEVAHGVEYAGDELVVQRRTGVALVIPEDQ